MANDPQQTIEAQSFRHQHIFRLLAGFAAIITLITSNSTTGYDMPLVILLTVLLFYTLLAHLLIRAVSRDVIKRQFWLAYIDAFMIGVVVAYIGFDLLPTILFIWGLMP